MYRPPVSVEQRARVLAGASQLDAEELTVYLEREGVKLAEYEQWRMALDEGRAASVSPGRPTSSGDRTSIQACDGGSRNAEDNAEYQRSNRIAFRFTHRFYAPAELEGEHGIRVSIMRLRAIPVVVC